jgi:hypothetical protein
MIAATSGPWAVVLRLQHAVAFPFAGHRVFGCDDALEVVLDGIAAGAVPEPQTIKNLCANRAGKDRHRRRLARQFASGDAEVDVIDAVHTRRLVAFARSVLGERDFAMLLDLADCSYDEVAAARGLPVGTLKARAARARSRVRHACAKRFGFGLSFASEAA